MWVIGPPSIPSQPGLPLLCTWTHHALPVQWTPAVWGWQIRKWVAQWWQRGSQDVAGVSQTAAECDTDADNRVGALTTERVISTAISVCSLPLLPALPFLLFTSQVAMTLTRCSFYLFFTISNIIIFLILSFSYDRSSQSGRPKAPSGGAFQWERWAAWPALLRPHPITAPECTRSHCLHA